MLREACQVSRPSPTLTGRNRRYQAGEPALLLLAPVLASNLHLKVVRRDDSETVRLSRNEKMGDEKALEEGLPGEGRVCDLRGRARG